MHDRIKAAAEKFKKGLTRRPKKTGDSWQPQAWSYYSDTPEVRFAANWVGNAMSRSRIFAGKKMPDGSVEPAPDNHPAAILVSKIAGGPSGQSQMLGDMGPHLVVAGEGWIIIHPNDPECHWKVVSVLEVQQKKELLEINVGDKKLTIRTNIDDQELDPSEPIAIRIWDPSPINYSEADSPVRGAFVILDELRLLNAAVAAIAKSRLVGRGMLFVSQGTRFPTSSVGGDAEDDWTELLMEVAETAYKDPDSAAACVPIIAEVPDDSMPPQRITFESEFDELAIRLREEAIRRWATASDTPAEIVLGTGDISHWGQWFTQESAITIGVESRLLTLVDGLTTQYLRPELQALNVPDADDWVIWYDTSALRARANKSQTAIEVYDRNGINAEALRRETGFEEGDAPTDSQQNQRLILEIMRAVPSIAPQLLPMLNLTADLPVEGLDNSGDSGSDLPQVRIPVDETRSPPDMPDFDEPGLDTNIPAALVSACDGVVYRALERAGQKLRSKQPRRDRPQLDAINPHEIHTRLSVSDSVIDEYDLLASAWDRVGEIAARHDADQNGLRNCLSGYARKKMCSQDLHRFGDLEQCLSEWWSDVA